MPDVIVQESMVPIDPDLTLPQPCPPVPITGDVETLLDWTERCTIAARQCNDQLDGIRATQN